MHKMGDVKVTQGDHLALERRDTWIATRFGLRTDKTKQRQVRMNFGFTDHWWERAHVYALDGLPRDKFKDLFEVLAGHAHTYAHTANGGDTWNTVKPDASA